jgi:hypothetical protein
MRDVLGKRVKPKVKDPDQGNRQYDDDHHDREQYVSLAGSRYERGQMMRRRRMNRARHQHPPFMGSSHESTGVPHARTSAAILPAPRVSPI